MRAAGDERQHFLSTYMRTTIAVKDEIERGGVRRRCLDRTVGRRVRRPLPRRARGVERGRIGPGPWRIAFEAANATPRVPPIRHLLLGMNAHINYDLPQALLAVISDAGVRRPGLLVARRRATTSASTRSSSAASPPRTTSCARRSSPETARCSTGCSRRSTARASKRFLKEARGRCGATPGRSAGARRQGLEALSAQAARAGGALGGTRRRPRRPGPGPATAVARRVRRAAPGA